ncbi:hypothetical protein QJS10_CPB21g00710 [Acorus calamus]|uniref:Uncharacterized protein n=1 Tax=Acorus calamus TaxID=4465 RepID=A0AAV9C4Y4_ACOCL|nr:hypothetical protein QJS10_CPB21g00710 [Acorus calamus]
MKSWKGMLPRSTSSNKGNNRFKMKMLSFLLLLLCIFIYFAMHRIASLHQYQSTRMETRLHLFDPFMVRYKTPVKKNHLPQGIVHAKSDMELKPLWLSKSSGLKESGRSHENLLAIPAGIKQKKNVDSIVRKFSSLQKNLQLSSSIMMEMSMAGMIFHGVRTQYI